MIIRKAELQDIQDILRIAKVLHLENVSGFVWDQEDYVKGQIASEEYFVGEEGGNIIGIISFRVRSGKMYIETLAVDPDVQASGVGSELIVFAKDYAKGRGFDMIYACAFFEYNNKDFYVKKGFTQVNSIGMYGGQNFYRFEANV